MPNNISKRISLTNAQKRQLCLDKEKKPTPTNGELALKYRIEYLSKKPAEVLRLCCNFSSNKTTILS